MRLFLIGCFFLFLFSVSAQKIDSLKVELEKHIHSDRARAALLNQIGFEYWIVNPVESIIYGQKARHLSELLGDSVNLAMAYRVIGVGFWARGIYDLALQHLYNGQGIYQQINDTLGVANCIMNTGMVYEEQKDHQRALTRYVQALELFEQLGEEQRIATTYNKMGTAFLEMGDLAEAEKYLNLGWEIHQKTGYIYGISESQNRLGLLYERKKDYLKALDFLKQSITLSASNNDQEGLAKSYGNIATVFLKMGNQNDAEAYLIRGADIARTIGSNKRLREIYYNLKDIYAYKGLYDEALFYAEKYIDLQDSIYNEETIRNIRDFEAQLLTVENERQLKEKEQEIKMLEQKASFEFIIRVGFMVLIGLLVIIGYLLYSWQRAKARRRQEKAEERARELNRELEMKNKELTSYTINFVQKNKLFEDLKEVLISVKQHSGLDQEIKQRFKDIDRIISSQLQVDKDWEDFKLRFQNLHQNFFDRLMERNSSLTNHELRLSALIRLNFSMKEIGNILGISAESVKTARYRLKKKLDLPQETNLNDYMNEIGG